MMRYCVVIALICVALVGELAQAARLSSAQEWTLFKSKHGKSYEDPAEEARRFANFMATKQRVERHNAQGDRSFRMGLNHLADWTREERAKLRSLRVHENYLTTAQERTSETEAFLAEILARSSEPVLDEFDWRKVPGRVSSVKNQGKCGSCWAHATVGVLEGQEAARAFNKTNQFASLSVQELVDCSKSHDFGCGGGNTYNAFDDIDELGGIMYERDYPYTGKDGKCMFDKKQAVMTDVGSIILPKRNESLLKEVLFKYGPISIGIDNDDSFDNYKSGFYSNDYCDDTSIYHAIMIVGYGTDPKDGDFWIIKNSYGSDWGENGYMRIKRGINMCAIAILPVIARF